MKIIKAENIKNEEIAKVIMDSMIPINQYLDQIEESSFEYEHICENVREQFDEILESFNLQKMKYTNTNIYITEIILFKMWDYLREEIDFNELLEYLRKEYSKAN